MTNVEIEEKARKHLVDYINSENSRGNDFRDPEKMADLHNKEAEIDLDKDLGVYGDWIKDSTEEPWGSTDIRLLKNSRLDAAAARHHSEAAYKSSAYARASLSKIYIIVKVLVAISALQLLILMYLIWS